jgi:hypothetical membrane protein
MSALQNADSCGEAVSGWWHSPRTTRLLLLAAIPAVVVYGIGDLVSGLLYDRYSFKDQAISELSAFGSPVRPLMVAIILVHGVLLLAFGIGIVRVARRRSMRWIGWLLVAGFFIVGLWNHTIWAMSSRDLEAGFNDTMHITLTMVFTLLVVAMMVLSAVAYRGGFRLYTLATMLFVAASGGAAASAIRGLEENDTPWAGGFERINAYAYFAWLVVLAVTVMRRERGASRASGERRDDRHAVPIAA